MKICEDEFTIARVGVPYLNVKQGKVRIADNILLAWAFFFVIAFMVGVLGKNVLFFMDATGSMICFAQMVMIRSSMKEDIGRKQKGGNRKEGFATKEDIFYIVSVVMTITGLLGINLWYQTGTKWVEKPSLDGSKAMLGIAVVLLVAKEGIYRYLRNILKKAPYPQLRSGTCKFRVEQLITVFILLSCMLLQGMHRGVQLCLLSGCFMILMWLAVSVFTENISL